LVDWDKIYHFKITIPRFYTISWGTLLLNNYNITFTESTTLSSISIHTTRSSLVTKTAQRIVSKPSQVDNPRP